MFFTYMRRELRRRIRQAIVIALGLGLGIGLVITVMGVSQGVRSAQAKVLSSLYGIGTDLTVTPAAKPPSGSSQGGMTIQGSPGGSTKVCVAGVCHVVTGGVLDQLLSSGSGTLHTSELSAIARLHSVASAAGGVLLNDVRTPLPTPNSSSMQQPTTFTVLGTDLSHPRLGPISGARVLSGRHLTSADANRDVALVDSAYAAGHRLKAGGTIMIGGVRFTIAGIVLQPQSGTPPNVYIPLARAQKLAIDPGSSKAMVGEVNIVYVTATSAAAIPQVQRELAALLPTATVTSEASLASQITGSLASTAKLARDLGTWLAIMVLAAAFAVAGLMTAAAVTRRVAEFGTLKALGWRGRRIVAQVLGESVVCGVFGGLAGVGLGVAGVAIINAIAPKLSASLPNGPGSGGPGGGPVVSGGPGAGGPGAMHQIGASPVQSVSVPMVASVTLAAIVLAVALAIGGGLLAGSIGGWRAGRLRPAAALAAIG